MASDNSTADPHEATGFGGAMDGKAHVATYGFFVRLLKLGAIAAFVVAAVVVFVIAR